MTDNKNEKENRKELLNERRKKAEEDFENSLPMSRENFKLLFEHLDKELSETDCDDTSKLTRHFLEDHAISNVDEVLAFLTQSGGPCDCEILAHAEDQFH